MVRLTKRQRELKGRYTKWHYSYCIGYQAELVIGCQSFDVGNPSSSKKQIEWLQKMLAIALDALLVDETNP